MSKYCMQCGKEIEDRVNNCPFCGSSQDNSFENNTVTKKHDPVVAIVAVISVILIVLIVILNLTVFNNKYKEPITNLFRAMETGEGKYIENTLPEYMIKESEEADEAAKQLNKGMSFLLGENFEISYEVLSKKEIDSEKLEKLEKEIKEDYDDSVRVSSGYTVEIELDIEGNINKSEETKINVYKIDGDWRLIDSDIF